MKPTGSIYVRAGRYWWRGKLPGHAAYKALPLKWPDQQFATKHRREAEQILADLWQRAEQALADSPPVNTLIEEFELEESRQNTPEHLANKLRSIREFTAAQAIVVPADITTRAVQAWLDAQAGRYSVKTVIDRRGHLGRFCRFLRKRGAIVGNPVEDSERPDYNPPDGLVLSDDELVAVLASAARHGILPEVSAAYYTGLRRSTLMRLRWRDVRHDSDGPYFAIPSKSIKTRKLHGVPICAKLWAILEPLRARPGDLIFTERKPHQWRDMLNPIKRDVPAFNVKRAGWHTFRRTVATRLVSDGVDVLPVAKLLGHSDIRMTARSYAYLESVKAARPHVEKL